MNLLNEIAIERRHVADQVRDMTPEQAAAPSLCRPWTVHEVVAHLATPYLADNREVLARIVRQRSASAASRLAASELAGKHTIAELATILDDNATQRYLPKKFDIAAYTDVIVHGNDIRRAVGMRHAIDPDKVAECLQFVSGKGLIQRFFCPEPRRAGLRFEATDTNWSHGAGPLVRGRAVDLLIVMCGRRRPSRLLDGDGVEILAGRLPNN